MVSDWKFLLDSLKEGKEEKLEQNSKVLIVDSTNTFMRCFSAVNHLNPELQHIGGLTGFLKSVGYINRIIRPTKIISVFDGQGNNTNKRYLYPDYKANRDILPVKNWKFDNKEEEDESKEFQLCRLINYLQQLPIHLLAIDKIEADDVIGYLCKNLPRKVTIMSSDRDFLQLVDDRIEVYNPTKKKFYTAKEVYEEFTVFPKNYCLYKTFLGDKGDNVPKIKGFGEEKLFKILPQIKDTKKLTLQESFDIINPADKWGAKILSYKNQLEINEKLIDLSNPDLPPGDLEEVNKVINNSNINFDKVSFTKMYNEDQLGNSISNLDYWLEDNFRSLTAF